MRLRKTVYGRTRADANLAGSLIAADMRKAWTKTRMGRSSRSIPGIQTDEVSID
ncbi:hypothetical protein SBC1_43640 (plasmid) [Caballeronia sp. SBC1]|nr:hypothetical protein SBC2_44290 [Caballeronia sp. SBC2]QIN64324.1 hypothetical protein SBC1_43640 [Caballeronia sp. SBC1]